MLKVAVIGANGQVGAELCLLLARLPEVVVVPICRTRSGSAYLRRHGIAVRHGSCADPAQARGLLGDCGLIVNSALATGTPREIRATEDAIVASALQASPPQARVIHFSTQSVYGDPRAGRLIRWRNPYGRAKLGTEKTALRAARRHSKSLFILRLGHVGGALQGISADMRAALAAGRVYLPAEDVPSNVVHTVTIVDAIRHIARGAVKPGIYDLMNVPQLTWAVVYEAERRSGGLPERPVRMAKPAPARAARTRLLRRLARLAAGEAARHLFAKLLAHAPPRLNARAHAWWHRARARAEIAALQANETPAEHLSWVANGSRFIEGLTPTLTLLANDPYRELTAESTGRSAWPQDLPLAADQPPAAAFGLVNTAT